MSTVRVIKKEDSQGDCKLWTVADLIVDLKRSGLSNNGIIAYLSGLEVSNEIKLDRGMTLSQFKNIIVKR